MNEQLANLSKDVQILLARLNPTETVASSSPSATDGVNTGNTSPVPSATSEPHDESIASVEMFDAEVITNIDDPAPISAASLNSQLPTTQL